MRGAGGSWRHAAANHHAVHAACRGEKDMPGRTPTCSPTETCEHQRQRQGDSGMLVSHRVSTRRGVLPRRMPAWRSRQTCRRNRKHSFRHACGAAGARDAHQLWKHSLTGAVLPTPPAPRVLVLVLTALPRATLDHVQLPADLQKPGQGPPASQPPKSMMEAAAALPPHMCLCCPYSPGPFLISWPLSQAGSLPVTCADTPSARRQGAE